MERGVRKRKERRKEGGKRQNHIKTLKKDNKNGKMPRLTHTYSTRQKKVPTTVP